MKKIAVILTTLFAAVLLSAQTAPAQAQTKARTQVQPVPATTQQPQPGQSTKVILLTPDQMPQSLNFLPGPPKIGDPLFYNDLAQYEWGKSLRDTPRGALAIADADLSLEYFMKRFGEPMGLNLNPEDFPATAEFMYATYRTCRASISKAKNEYARKRPYQQFSEHTPLPQSEDADVNTSYPSGHTVRSWALALALLSLDPEHQDQILKVAYDMGQSRVILGYHYQSDVDDAKMAASAGFARLVGVPEWWELREKAKVEIDAAKAKKEAAPANPAIASSLPDPAPQDFNCFGIIAGREATRDGNVLFAHNEDDGGEQMLNIWKMPATDHSFSYLWFEFPGLKNADGFLNEWGVSLATDKCSSREDCEPGIIQYELRTAVAQRATSARNAVELIGRLVEEYGYADTGRSYLVADPREAWVCAVVKGHHWVAQRVPDDEVMVIPNYYVIGEVDLSDKANFLGSPDLIEYAVSKGWYDPSSGKPFNFRIAYSDPATLNSDFNKNRHEAAQNALFGDAILGDQAVFSRKPDHKITREELQEILGKAPINRNSTVLSSVFEMNAGKPCIAWSAYAGQGEFVPWTISSDIPSAWQRCDSPKEALENHFKDTDNLRARYPESPYWPYVDLRSAKFNRQ